MIFSYSIFDYCLQYLEVSFGYNFPGQDPPATLHRTVPPTRISPYEMAKQWGSFRPSLTSYLPLLSLSSTFTIPLFHGSYQGCKKLSQANCVIR